MTQATASSGEQISSVSSQWNMNWVQTAFGERSRDRQRAAAALVARPLIRGLKRLRAGATRDRERMHSTVFANGEKGRRPETFH